jgi:hypothetical protein
MTFDTFQILDALQIQGPESAGTYVWGQKRVMVEETN